VASNARKTTLIDVKVRVLVIKHLGVEFARGAVAGATDVLRVPPTFNPTNCYLNAREVISLGKLGHSASR
jgi:hypothetical protein